MKLRHHLARLRRSLLSGRGAGRPAPRQQRPCLGVEALEDRRVPAFISFDVTFTNRSNATLHLVSTNLDHGEWDSYPPGTIGAGATVAWETESNGVATGTEGEATYQIGDDPKPQTTLHWDDPFIGDNSFDESAPVGYLTSNDGPEEGNNVRVNFTITLDAARDRPLSSSSWTAIGPGAMFTGQAPADSNGASPPTVSGRVTGLAADPTSQVVYAATAGGGVWKDVSNSAGSRPDSPAGNSSGDWVPLTDNLSDAAGNPIPEFMGAVAVAPSKGSVVYAGTGEANNAGDSYWGEGVLVSKDGGQSWALTGQLTFNRTAISKIVIDPQDPGTAWVAVSNNASNGNPNAATGIFRTSDYGATWTNTTATIDTADPWSDLVIDPTTTTQGGGKATLFAAVGNPSGSASDGVYQSTDSGANWSLVKGVPGVAGSGRIALTLSRPTATASATIYVSIASATKSGSSSLQALDVSTDGGSTWAQQNSTPNYLTTLGWYGNAIQANPSTPTMVFAAGAGNGNTIFESTDGGANWTSISKDSNGVSPHADNHALAFDASGRLLDGNDGGAWRLDSNNLPAFSWEDLNGWETLNAAGLSVNQVTGIALSPASSQVILSGSQDNGTNLFKGGQATPFASSWANVAGNDGGFVRIDPTDTNPSGPITAFTTYQYPLVNSTGTLYSFQRIGGLGNTNALANISGGIGKADPSDFYPPYVIDPNNAQRLILGTNKLYVSTDQGGTGGDWSVLGTFPTSNLAIDSIAVAPSNSKWIYVGASQPNNRNTFKLYVTSDGGSTWKDITPPVALAAATLSTQGVFQRIAVSPSDPKTAYAVVSAFTTGNVGEVWQTTDGSTWTDVTGTGLPNVPIESVALVPGVNALVVGTDVGMYGTVNVNRNKTTWARVGTGLPNVQVADIQTGSYSDTGGVVAVGTHGRGVWEIEVSPKVSLRNGVLTLSGTAFGGNYTIRLKAGDPGTLQVSQGPTLLGEYAVAAVNQVQVNGAGGTTTLTLDFGNGNLIPAGGLSFDGGPGGGGRLQLVGGTPYDTETYTAADQGSGSIALYGRTVTYTRLAPIDDTTPARSLVFNAPGANDAITVTGADAPVVNGVQTAQINSGDAGTFELVNFANKGSVTINDLLGNNVLTVDFSSGNPIPVGGLNFNGGGGRDRVVLQGGFGDHTYQTGLAPGSGSVITNTVLGLPANVLHFEHVTEPLMDTVAGDLTVEGTPADNAINVTSPPPAAPPPSDSVSAAAADDFIAAAVVVRPPPLNFGLVTVDNFLPISFANKLTLNIDGGPGIDTVHINVPSTPTGLGQIHIDGGDPTSDDRLIVNGVSTTVPVNVAVDTSTITGAAGSNGAVPITYANIERLTVNLGSTPTLAITGSNDYTYNPAAAPDAGTVIVPYTPGGTPVDPVLPIDFTGLTPADTLSLTADGSGTTVVNGTAADDNFFVAPDSGEVRLTTASATPFRRMAIAPQGMSALVLNGLGGDDGFTVSGAQPYANIYLGGNGLADGDRAAVIGDGSAMSATVGDGRVVTSYAGVSVTARTAVVSLDAGSGKLTVDDVVQAVATITPTGARGGTFQAGGTAPRLDFATDGTFTADLTDARRKLVVNGPESDSVIAVDGGAVTVTGLKAVNYTGVSALTVNGGAGADTFNVVPSAVAYSLDGGDPVGGSPGNQLVVTPGNTTVTFYPGPTGDSGSFVAGANKPISFKHMQSYRDPTSSVVVNGTNGNDVITVQAADGNTDPAADGVQDFTVSVNAGPDFLFLDTPALTVNTRSGNDQVVVEAPAPDGADWNVSLTINGGLRLGNANVLVATPGGSVATYAPSAAHAGTLKLLGVTKDSPIALTNVGQLTYDGGGSGLLDVVPGGGNHTVTVTPGAADDAGLVTVDRLLPITFQDLGPGGLLSDHVSVTDTTTTDTLLIKGVPGDNTFGVTPGLAAAFVTVNSRVPVEAFGLKVVQLVGGSGNNTLTGPNVATTWNIAGTNAGSLVNAGAKPISFVNVQNLTGGAAGNTFVFANGAGVTGAIDGGAGAGALNYAAYTTGVRVNLASGRATGVGRGVRNVHNVTGGSGNDLIFGDNQGDVLTAGGGNDILVGGAGVNVLNGGTGRDLLIGGRGRSTLNAGSGDALMIAGFTAYDANVVALSSLLAEWARTDLSYQARISHLAKGGGLNGRYVLKTGDPKDPKPDPTTWTVFGNDAGNTLNGGTNASALDWFWAQATDAVKNPNASETTTTIPHF